MATPKFSISEAVRYGYKEAKLQWKFFVPVLLVIGLIHLIPHNLSFNHPESNSSPILTLIFWLLNLLIGAGLIKIALDLYNHRKVQFQELFSQTEVFWNFLLGSLIYAGIVIGGLILLIIPGIIWGIKYEYFSYLIIEKKMKPMEAIKKSGQITSGYKWDLFLLGLTMAGINILGGLALGIGLFFTASLTIMTSVYVYKKLS